jgi:hypothetical protein
MRSFQTKLYELPNAHSVAFLLFRTVLLTCQQTY